MGHAHYILHYPVVLPNGWLNAGRCFPAPARTGIWHIGPTPGEIDEFMKFEEVEHTADWALRIFGRNLAELFGNAAAGMNSLMRSSVAGDAIVVTKRIELEAVDAESLLVAWLSELAFWAETESLIFSQFDFLELSPARLRAVIQGGPIKELEKHVKAVTFHNLAIRRSPEGLEVTVVFDV
jgi:SHS2 domain-containing protein